MILDDALELVIDGHALLFAGAGFSRGATNLLGKPFKTASELATHLAREANLPDETPLDDASEEFMDLHGAGTLVDELQNQFTVSAVTVGQRQIASLPWRRIYTTNYDNVLESAYDANRRILKPVTLSEQAQLRNDVDSETLCVHLNGYIKSLTRENIGSELKLTDTSYLTASVSDSPWATKFRQDLTLARAVFFVGYSLSDLDIRRLLFESPQLSQKSFFVIGNEPGELIKRRIARFGEIVPLDTSEFSDLIERKSETYLRQEPETHIGYSIKQFSIPSTTLPFSDQSIFDLLMLGQLKVDFLWESLHEGNQYFLERYPTQSILEIFEKGSQVAVVHSELGNGKTLFLEGLKCRSIENAYNVYSVTVRGPDLFRELDQVLRSRDKTILFIDDYPDWLDVIERFGHNAKANHALVVSARSAVHDVVIDSLCEKLGVGSIPEYSADLLTYDEIGWVISFFDQYGLWADKAAWSDIRKRDYVTQICGSQFNSVLIGLFESPQIASRFDQVLQQLNDKRDYYEVLLSIMILPVIQHAPTTNLIMDIWGTLVLETQFKSNPTVRQFVDFQAGQVKMRSALAAQFILKHVADVNITVDTLLVMAKAFNRARRLSQTHYRVLRELMRFSNLQNLLPERQRRRATIRYYEGIRNLDGCRRNHQFWLQYAIACLTLGELDRAETYFATAYSFANARGYETYQIDNHYARFMLVRAISLDDVETCMTAFRKARNIIQSQIQVGRRHYPYRVARSFYDFYDAFESKLSEKHREEIAKAAAYISRRIESLPEYRYHRNVQECYLAMQKIIARQEAIQMA